MKWTDESILQMGEDFELRLGCKSFDFLRSVIQVACVLEKQDWKKLPRK